MPANVRLLVATLALTSVNACGDEFAALPREDENSRVAHAQLVEKTRQGKIDLYFLGDSITRRWGCTDPAYEDLMANWRRHFHGWNAANFGWGGDTTHNVLWRVRNGEFDGFEPKVIVLQAGTNDIGWRSYTEEQASAKVDEVARGIDAIIQECFQRAPRATLLLTGVFPREDVENVNPLVEAINERLARHADDERVRWININDRLTDPQGRLLEGITVDGLHLSGRGYDAWAAALRPHLLELLGPPADDDLAPPPTGNPGL